MFDLASGKEAWSSEEDVFGTWLSYSEKHDILIESGRVARDTLFDEPKGMRAYSGVGKVLWSDKGYSGPAMIHGDDILQGQGGCDLKTGKLKMRVDPISGLPVPWTWVRNYGCNTPAASEHLLTFRSGAAGFFDLCHDGGTGNLGGFRSSCTNNLIVAGGLLTAPDYTRTCTCSYQNQTSVALIHMPEVEVWTSYGTKEVKGAIKRLGVNFGAPGDRMADDGTLWLEYPSVGGTSPALAIKTKPAKLETFRRHSSVVEGPLPWVGSSGVRGLEQFTLTLDKFARGAKKYTVRLYFAEPDDLVPGQRVFRVEIQGKARIDALDVVREAGGPRRSLVKEFRGVSLHDELFLKLTPAPGSPVPSAILNGLEIIAEE
ncbi:MAG: malectin domain-containing carbohydrate-binding protein [Gemmataceae bacterium]